MALVGGEAKLSVEVSGNNPEYKWFNDGGVIENASGTVLVLSELSLNDAGKYWVEISNPTGTIRSAVIDLDVVAAPIITSAPTSVRKSSAIVHA